MDEQRDMNEPVVDDPGQRDGESLVAQFEKSATEQLRFTLGRYKGREVFGVRVWVGLTDDTLRPTRKGVTLRVESFPQFRAAIGQLEAAIAARVSDEDGDHGRE